jgi:hypothetical protein
LLCGVREPLKAVLDKAGTSERVGDKHIFVEQAVRQTSTHQALLRARELVGQQPKDQGQVQTVPRWLRNAAVGG